MTQHSKCSFLQHINENLQLGLTLIYPRPGDGVSFPWYNVVGSLQEEQMVEINLGLFSKDERAVGHCVHSRFTAQASALLCMASVWPREGLWLEWPSQNDTQDFGRWMWEKGLSPLLDNSGIANPIGSRKLLFFISTLKFKPRRPCFTICTTIILVWVTSIFYLDAVIAPVLVS